MDSVGARLRNARLAKNVSIEEIYKKTKIHPNVLSALEEDRFSSLNPVYLRSFLKQYAGFLGLNPQELVAGLQPPKMKVETVDEIKEKKRAEKQEADTRSAEEAPVAEKIAPLAKQSAVSKPAQAEKVNVPQSLFEDRQVAATPVVREPKQSAKKVQPVVKDVEPDVAPEHEVAQQPVNLDPMVTLEKAKPYLKFAGIVLGVILALWVTFKTIRFVVIQTKRAVAGMMEKRKEAKAAQKKSTPESKTKTATQQAKNVIASKSANQFASLSIRAKEDSWIQLKTDGRTAFQGVLKRGYSESWTANEKMDLAVGNAGGVEITVNGNPIPSLGKRKQSIKGIVITKEGLNIPR